MMGKGKMSKGKKAPKLGIMIMVGETPMGKAYGKAKKQMKKGKKK
jgi:hypothetical protein